MKVFRKTDEMNAMQWARGNDEEIAKFIDYRNKYPLYTEDGSQLRVLNNNNIAQGGYLYLSLGDWIVTHNGIVMAVLTNERFREKYVAI